MMEQPDPNKERASREATDWLILLQEEPQDPDVLRRFNNWLNESAVHEAAWAETWRTADAIGTVSPSYSEDWQPFVEQFRQVHANPQTVAPLRRSSAAPRRSQTSNWRWAGRGAALAAAIGVVALLVPDLLLQFRADYKTGIGETRTLRLTDSSTVLLAPDSALAVAFSANERHVSLLAGEAFFQVAPNPERPFHVTTRDIRTTVQGTAFNVIRDGEGATITLQHGKVLVAQETASPQVSEQLETGQSVRVSWSGDVVRSSKPLSQVAAWRNGQLLAQDQAMGVVIARLRRYVGDTIVLADPTLSDRSVTGVYNLNDPVEALRGIAHTHGATVYQITPWILVVASN